MKKIGNKAQNGYVLLILLLSLMAMGGVAIEGYTQAVKREVDTSRYNHNKRVLEQAKQALLMYAYRYPEIASRGPGRLPCPDMNNSGTPNPWTDCIGQISGDAMVGRFPWATNGIEFFDALDADGERLWYAVSASFSNFNPGSTINSNTIGTITLFDQSGNIIYDGALEGIAAVIMAPGAAQKRDNDGNGTYEFTQLRATGAQQIDPRNYLDTFGNFDNSLFINSGSNDTDGFILGPIYDDNVSDFVVNDQLIIVTTEEVIAMAEQSVLDTYQRAINTYLTNTGGVYPWLDSFVTNDLTEFDADIGSFRGRVPAVFNNYFAGAGEDIPFYTSETKFLIEPDPGARNPGDLIEFDPPQAFTDVSFDAAGNLLTTVNAPYGPVTLYFWDGHDGITGGGVEDPNSPRDDIWELCTGNASATTLNPEDDCNRKTDGTFKTGADVSPNQSDVWLAVYRVTVTLNGAGRYTLPFADIVTGPSGFRAATGGENAYVFGVYDDAGGSFAISYEFDNDFRSGFDILAFDTVNELAAGIVYYPELPAWALDNDWHHSVQVAIAEDYQPGGNNADCTVNGCLVVNNLPAVDSDNISLLVIAGEVDDLVDDGAAGFFDDLTAQFEAENDTFNITYDRRAGNDSVLVIQ